MEYNLKFAVVYKEDVMSALGCSPYVALQMMKRTGTAFKIGKRWAISSDAFLGLINGNGHN